MSLVFGLDLSLAHTGIAGAAGTDGVVKRILAKVTRSDRGCWEFSGCVANPRSDHRQISYKGRMRLAHRVMWEQVVGPIPPGMFVCHHCDNPPCVNPTHLYVGTAKDNVFDRDSRGRGVLPPRRQSGPLQHGTLRGYNRGCRCDECRARRNLATKQSRDRRRARLEVGGAL